MTAPVPTSTTAAPAARSSIVIGVFSGLAMIAGLAAIFLPACSGALVNTKSSQAENTAHQVKNAISSYHAEYRRYPTERDNGDVTLDTDEELMGVLLGSDREAGTDGLNPRRIVFYTDKAARPIGDGRFARGLTLDEDGSGTLWDPWGRPYRVRLDTDYDNRVENPDPSAKERVLSQAILVWSAGPDGDFDTWEDNVKTW